MSTDSDLRAQRFGHYEAFAAAEPEHYTELEAMALVARLSQILTAPYQIYFDEPEDEPRDESQDSTDAEESAGASHDAADDNDTQSPRDIEPSDIAILIRSRTHLKKYESVD